MRTFAFNTGRKESDMATIIECTRCAYRAASTASGWKKVDDNMYCAGCAAYRAAVDQGEEVGTSFETTGGWPINIMLDAHALEALAQSAPPGVAVSPTIQNWFTEWVFVPDGDDVRVDVPDGGLNSYCMFVPVSNDGVMTAVALLFDPRQVFADWQAAGRPAKWTPAAATSGITISPPPTEDAGDEPEFVDLSDTIDSDD